MSAAAQAPTNDVRKARRDSPRTPTVAEAGAFLDDAEARFARVGSQGNFAGGLECSKILLPRTPEQISADANQVATALGVELAKKGGAVRRRGAASAYDGAQR